MGTGYVEVRYEVQGMAEVEKLVDHYRRNK